MSLTAPGAEQPAAKIRAQWREVVAAADRVAAAGGSTGGSEQPAVAGRLVSELAESGALDLPLPGGGCTSARFDALAALGEIDLTIGRLAEAHTDAVAILTELHGPSPERGQVWGVWAAEPPTARVLAHRTAVVGGTGWELEGRKAWCSGAGVCTHALITAHADDGSRLFAVDLAQSAVTRVDDTWPALALTGSDTRSVDLSDAVAVPVGEAGDYVGRPGFWHGAVGVAAVWYGGAVAVARALPRAHERRALDDLGLMHLGAVDAAIGAAGAALDAAAGVIDADPRDTAQRAAAIARRTRAVVEAAAATVIDRVGRALGAAPLAMDREHARRVADLQLYLRQSHADRDLADLGRLLTDGGVDW